MRSFFLSIWFFCCHYCCCCCNFCTCFRLRSACYRKASKYVEMWRNSRRRSRNRVWVQWQHHLLLNLSWKPRHGWCHFPWNFVNYFVAATAAIADARSPLPLLPLLLLLLQLLIFCFSLCSTFARAVVSFNNFYPMFTKQYARVLLPNFRAIIVIGAKMRWMN